MKINKLTAEHFKWGNGNDGWRLLEDHKISIIHERMSVGASEVTHYHEVARQFFFVLEGQVEIEIEGDTVLLERHEGVEVEAKLSHRIFNRSNNEVEFLVYSQPSTNEDRHLSK